MTERNFQRIYDLFWSRVYNIVYSYFQDPTTAKKVTEDVFTNLWLKEKSFDNVEDIENFILQSVKNKIFDEFDRLHSRKKQKKKSCKALEQHPDKAEGLRYSQTLALLNQNLQ